MKTTRVVKGKPLYLYRRRQYIYQPEKTYTSIMRYDEESNTTYIYCYKTTIIPEVVLVSILVSLVFINLFILHGEKVSIYYNNYTTYYNGTLYINLTSDAKNNYEVNYDLIDSGGNIVAGGNLSPGDSVITIPVYEPDTEYIIRLHYKTLLTERESSLKIYVDNKDGKSIEE